MRIIAGKYRGHRLAPVSKGIRPSSDCLRETLFNVLGESVVGSTWLEAFAGSGAVGLEALSRGTYHVIFNDRNRQALRLVRRNLSICRVDSGYEIHQMPVLKLLRKLNVPRLDFIFLDPPYDFEHYQKLLRAVCQLPAVGTHTRIVLELFKGVNLEILDTGLSVSRKLRVGNSQLVFLGMDFPVQLIAARQ